MAASADTVAQELVFPSFSFTAACFMFQDDTLFLFSTIRISLVFYVNTNAPF